MPPLPLVFVFLSSPPKTLSFSRRPPNLSQKNYDLRFIHRWIIMKFKKQVCNSIPSLFTVGKFEIMLELRKIHFAS
ncbi:hypothetical protein HKD37_13G036570 [Glycine soja]